MRDCICIAKGWSLAKIADLTETVTSGSRGWAQYYSGDGPLFLRVGNLNHDTVALDLRNTQRVRPPRGAEGQRTLVRQGDVLISITAEVGMVGLVPESIDEAYVNQHVALIRPLPSVFPAGLAYSLLDPQGLQAVVRSVQYGATKPGLSLEQVREFEVPIPPLPEQHRIVEAIESYFTRLDDAVVSLERVKRNLKRYRASVLQAAVEGRLVPTEAELARAEGRDYEPASVLLERILEERRRRWKESGGRGTYKEPQAPDTNNLPELPEGWCWVTVDQVAAHEVNALTDGPFGSNLKTSHYTTSGPRVIRLQNIGDGRFLDEKAHISEKHFETLKKHSVQPGDIVIASLGQDLPRACLVPKGLGQAIVKADCIKFSVHRNTVDPAYANHALNSPPLKKRAESLTHGLGRPRIGLTLLRQIVLPLPPKAEQSRIVAEVDNLLDLGLAADMAAQEDIFRCSRLRQSILKWAFEGKLVDQDPNDEPASVLLERIQAERKAATKPKGAEGPRQRRKRGV